MSLVNPTRVSVGDFAEELEKDLGIFAENLAELQIKTVEVPQDIKIPNWPKVVDMRIKLGKRNCFYPIQTDETGMLRLVRKRRRMIFSVSQSGTFGFWTGILEAYFEGTSSNSNLQRIRALVLFHQFKEEIFLKIIQELKAGLGDHNQVIAMVEKAIGPFVPFLVADQLSS